jgi:hypothetical protein
LRYVPDKTITVAMAMAIIRYGLPVFKYGLTLGGPAEKPPTDNWVGPIYFPLFLHFLNKYQSFWALWCVPLVIASVGLGIRLWHGPSSAELIAARNERLKTYLRVLAALEATVPFASATTTGCGLAPRWQACFSS